MADPVRILFVCLGNICRSPTAEGVFQKKISEAGLADRVQLDSAGTGHWHVGKAPDARAREAAASRGYELAHLRARQVTEEDFHQFDYVLAMDHANLSDLRTMQPENSRARLALFLEYGDGDTDEVPDPYYGGDAGFERVLDLIEDASDGLILDVRKVLDS